MLRKLSAIAAAGVTILGLTALPAAAASTNHPQVHKFTLPPVTGIKAWGSYYTAGGKAHITLCVKEVASSVDLAVASAIAVNADASKHQNLSVHASGTRQQSCKSLVTGYTAHLYAVAISGTKAGKVYIGKPVRIY